MRDVYIIDNMFCGKKFIPNNIFIIYFVSYFSFMTLPV